MAIVDAFKAIDIGGEALKEQLERKLAEINDEDARLAKLLDERESLTSMISVLEIMRDQARQKFRETHQPHESAK